VYFDNELSNLPTAHQPDKTKDYGDYCTSCHKHFLPGAEMLEQLGQKWHKEHWVCVCVLQCKVYRVSVLYGWFSMYSLCMFT
jgi:hypothetical protein